MIAKEALGALARKYQTSEFPNIVREYFQHLFLSELYKLPGSEKMLFKGGTALRIIYGSPRFSEDLDFSLFGIDERLIKKFTENLFINVLAKIGQAGVKVELKEANPTSGGYFGVATFVLGEYPFVGVEINISSRNGRKVVPEADSIASDFVPTYTILHLPKEEIVEEKIFSALPQRKKERDFYDLYFILRKGMIVTEQKSRLAAMKNEILQWVDEKNFRGELGALLPIGQQAIIADFRRALTDELGRQIADI
ncbi:nucleotidyl transferase AbiEii/AbiGii toxin family protein [candidate division WS5 bacterium]|uniref:Nucleotidyl transferase AbiEii/AbiGii toxin family protein n=1 Tax=candidate division WS5 bacterium TaxID=2093353 RepID=A0A419DB24_9BACT|nr:MAG: nucleotidyl transferase AbiEii/AbiGii toxin family protein [candidate division WS5 bacterium]